MPERPQGEVSQGGVRASQRGPRGLPGSRPRWPCRRHKTGLVGEQDPGLLPRTGRCHLRRVRVLDGRAGGHEFRHRRSVRDHVLRDLQGYYDLPVIMPVSLEGRQEPGPGPRPQHRGARQEAGADVEEEHPREGVRLPVRPGQDRGEQRVLHTAEQAADGRPPGRGQERPVRRAREDAGRRHPEVLQEPVRAPAIACGPPTRPGTPPGSPPCSGGGTTPWRGRWGCSSCPSAEAASRGSG